MTQQLTITVEGHGPSLTLRLRGELDMASADSLRACMESLIGSTPELVLDLEELAFIDSSGLACIIRAHVARGEHGGRLILRNPRGAVAKAIEVGGVAGVVPVIA